MTIKIRWSGTKTELIDALRRIPQILAGKLPDVNGVVRALLLRVGMVLLGRLQHAFEVASTGQQNALGITWKPLSPVTLLLRRTGSVGPKSLAALKARIAKMPLRSQKRIKHLYRQQLATLRGVDTQARQDLVHALDLLEKRNRLGLVTKTRYNQLRKLLTGRAKQAQIEQYALAQATALILRDTGRLLNSLSPGIAGGDRILEATPGRVVVGSNVDYLKFHQSSRPRRLKADGTPKLPRRQVLPDDAIPIPPEWYAAMTAECAKGIASREFLLAVLGPKAA